MLVAVIKFLKYYGFFTCIVLINFVSWICHHYSSLPLIPSFLFAAYIPIYLYPLLNTVSDARSFESLRLTSLGVIGALVKVIYTFTQLSMDLLH